jgi:hypothetical protein
MARKWTLVECEIEKKVVNGKPLTDFRPTATNPAAPAPSASGSGRAEKERRRRSSRAFGRDRSSSVDDYGLEDEEPLDSQQLAYAVHVAILNIEYLFSADSLVQDVYLRSLMDHEGFVPLVYVMQYPDLMYSPAPSEAILQGLTHSSRIEVDIINETLRLRVGWKPFLLPNDKGGVGLVHRYIKDSSLIAAPATSTTSTLSADAAPYSVPLRAVANEFVPKAN